MSIQGTGSIDEFSYERQLLDNWGLWATGDIGLWYRRVELLQKSGPGLMFTDEDLYDADRAIATLPSAHKNTIKKVYLKRKGLGIHEDIKQAAVAAFAESLQGIGEE